jgi:hypothetical protein
MKKIKRENSIRKEQLIKKIIVWIIIAIILGLILTAALGNLDAIKTLWKTP